jgi:hypothetical protein
MLRTLFAPVVVLTLATTTLGAQDTARVAATGAKSPMTARVIGIVPGAGHIYAGETMRGLGYLGATAGIIVLGGTLLAAECVGSLGESCENSNTEDVATVAALGVWAWSIYDAGRAAHRTNAKRRLRVSLIVAPVRSTLARGADGRALDLGLSLATR